MSRNSRTILALAMCMSICSMALADAETASRGAVPYASPAVERESAYTDTPTSEPSVTTAGTPTSEPSVTTTDMPTSEPSPPPAGTPTSEPSTPPADTPTSEPSAPPTALPTSEPTALPTATAEPVPTAEPSLIEIKLENAVLNEENAIWQVSYQSEEDSIALSWMPVETATSYAITLTDPLDNVLFALSDIAVSAEIPVALLGKDTYRLSITAYSGEAPIMQGEIYFVLVQSMLPPGGDMPEGGLPGGGISGGMPSTNMPGGMTEGAMPGDSGFRITPGEALTSSHSSGTKNMRAFGTLDMTISNEAMSRLSIGGAELQVYLDDEQPFYAACEGDTLILTPKSGGAEWSLNAFALKLLRRSGIGYVRLMLDGTAIDISTELELQGDVYAKLSSNGYVSKDYTLKVSSSDISISAGGQTYHIDNNNELIGD